MPPIFDKGRQKLEESSFEAECRKAADFSSFEAKLPSRFTKSDVNSISRGLSQIPDLALSYTLMPILGLLGSRNPLRRKASSAHNLVWIFDNPSYKKDNTDQWEAEFVAAFFHRGRQDLTNIVSSIADAMGLDGKKGLDNETRSLIAARAEPFINAIAPARTLPVIIGQQQKVVLGPSDASGISNQYFPLQQGKHEDSSYITTASDQTAGDLPTAKGNTYFYEPEGWAVISDIDDTIKITQTSDPIGILRTTFAQPPKPTEHMPDFYKILNEQFKNPAWFYLSASPYNLYPFLHQFIDETYPPGTIILRESSWQTFGGLLSSLTQGVQAYKTSRMDKIHEWFPKRKCICVGDSTQSDPESYAEIYKRYPGWIKAIYIRKVTSAPFMEQKNKDERFTKAFEGVPSHVWKVFELPDELKDHISHLAGEAHMGMVGSLTGFFCDHQHSMQNSDRALMKAQMHLPSDDQQ